MMYFLVALGPNELLLSFCCCHGDGNDGWHVCTNYYVVNCLRLFVVVAMAMVVMGGMCVQSITAITYGCYVGKVL